MKITTKYLLILLSCILTIVFFIPTWASVSVYSLQIKLSCLTLVKGIQYVMEPKYIVLVLLLLPFISFVLCFINDIEDRKKGIIHAVLFALNTISWLVFQSELKKGLSFLGAGGKFTFAYYLALISGILGTVVCIFILVKKLGYKTNLMDAIKGNTVITENNGDSSNIDLTKVNETASILKDGAKDTFEKVKNLVNENAPKIVDKVKSLPKKTLGIIGGFVVLVAVVVSVFLSNAKTINLKDYIIFETNGYNGYGYVSKVYDYEAFNEKYLNKIKLTKAGKNKLGNNYLEVAEELAENPSYILEYISLQPLTDTNGLSNGDEVVYSVVMNEEAGEYLDIKIKNKEIKIKVEGLQELESRPILDEGALHCYGVSGEGYCEFVLDDYRVYPNLENLDGDLSEIKNGDSVRVSLTDEDIEKIASGNGILPTEVSKDFIVSGLAEKLTDLSQISDSELERLNEEALDNYYDHINDSWSSESEELVEVSLEGQVLYSRKNKNSQLFLIYYTDVSNTSKDVSEDFEYYWYAKFDSATIEGESINYNRMYTPSHRVRHEIDDGSWSGHSWYYYGYEDIDSLLKDIKLEGYDKSENLDY